MMNNTNLALEFSEKRKGHSPAHPESASSLQYGKLFPDARIRGSGAPASRIIRHDEIGETALRDVVEKVLLPDICELAVVWRYL